MSKAGVAHSSSINHPATSRITPVATLHSTPDTVLWGYLAANLSPALTIHSGQIVEIEALSHQGLTTNQDPANFSAPLGSPLNLFMGIMAISPPISLGMGVIYAAGSLGRKHGSQISQPGRDALSPRKSSATIPTTGSKRKYHARQSAFRRRDKEQVACAMPVDALAYLCEI